MHVFSMKNKVLIFITTLTISACLFKHENSNFFMSKLYAYKYYGVHQRNWLVEILLMRIPGVGGGGGGGGGRGLTMKTRKRLVGAALSAVRICSNIWIETFTNKLGGYCFRKVMFNSILCVCSVIVNSLNGRS